MSVLLNDTNFDDGPTLLWNAGNLGDDDHQLFVSVYSLEQNGFVVLDYLEYVVPSLHFLTKTVFQQGFCFQG